MDTLIFNVLVAVVVALIGIITRNILPFLRAKKDEAMAKLRRTRWAWAADIVDAVVRAVEQTLSEELHGEDKKYAAASQIRKILGQNSLSLTEDQIDTLIEAAVQAMNAETIEIETGGEEEEDGQN